jgi:hypothetical protein
METQNETNNAKTFVDIPLNKLLDCEDEDW